MPISMYSAAMPPMRRSLINLRAIIEKAAAHAEAKKIDPSALVDMRLYPDMFPLSRQVQLATDTARGAASRLGGVKPPKYADDETTLPQLTARIDKTVAYLETFKPEQIDGSEDKIVTLPGRDRTLTFTGMSYLTDFVLPNIYFHATAAYAILRHCGVELGKADYLGKLS